MPRVAWVMVNHDGGEEVLASVKSLLADLTEQDRLILVDNGSVDESADLVLKRFQSVILLRNSSNQPFSSATNRGVKYALENGYSLVGIVNPDVRIQRGMTETLVRALDSGSKLKTGAVAPVMTLGNSNRIWFAGGTILWPLAWIMNRGMGKQIQQAYQYHGLSDYLTGCCWLAPRGVWEDVGLLDERYVFYAEDADWSLRARGKGYILRVVSNAILQHNVSTSTKGRYSATKIKYRTAANRKFFAQHTPARYRPFQIVGGCIMGIVYAGFLLLKGRWSSFVEYCKASIGKPVERMPWPPSQQRTSS